MDEIRQLKSYILYHLDKGYSKKAIKQVLMKQIDDHEFVHDIVEKVYNHTFFRDFLPIATLVILLFVFVFIRPALTGLVISDETFNFTQEIGLTYASDGEFTLFLENLGTLKSIRLNGNILNQGSAKVYLEHNNTRYQIFASSYNEPINSITGLAIDEEVIKQNNKAINIDISSEGSNEVLEFDINPDFSWDVDYGKLCTKWTVNDVNICYGNEDCCSFIDLESYGSWDDTFYLSYQRYNSQENNNISAQVIYANYSLNVEDPYSDIIYSNTPLSSATFHTTNFLDTCIDTCLLPGFNSSSYKLIFEIKNTTLKIDSVSYSLVQKTNLSRNPPEFIGNISDITIYKNNDKTIDLSNYFSDQDDEELTYLSYEIDDFTVLINDSIATIIPEYNYTGTQYLFFTASDGFYSATSNVFAIKVIEPPAKIEYVNISEETIKPKVIINKPVRWIKRINVTDKVVNLTVNISNHALNVTVLDTKENKTIDEKNILVNDQGTIKNATTFRAEKRISQIEKIEDKLNNEKREIIRETPVAKQEVSEINQELLVLKEERNELTGYVIANRKKGLLTRFFEWLFNVKITGYATLEPNENSTNVTSIIIEELVEEIEVEYYTEAPEAIEEDLGMKKKVTISSLVNYTDILAYSYLPVEASLNETMLYWINESRYIEFEAFDTNNNSLIDYIEWVVPHLSAQVHIVEVNGANTTLKIWDETDSGELFGGFVRYAKNLTYFFANYSNRTNGNPITDATCNISFSGSKGTLTYDSNYGIYSYLRNFTRHGTYAFNITCTSSSYSSLNTSDTILITQALPGFSNSGNSFTAVDDSSLVFADYDNDDDWDLVISGNDGTARTAKFYKNTDNTFAADSSYSITAFEWGSLSFGDIDKDGDLDLVTTGSNNGAASGNQTTIYLNNGSAFVANQNLSGVMYSSAQLGDYDNDGDLDIALTGTTNKARGGVTSKTYKYIEGTYNLDSSLQAGHFGSISLFEATGDDFLDLIVSGYQSGVGTHINILDFYDKSTTNTFNLTGIEKSSHAIADIDNDGDLDLVTSGSINKTANGGQLSVYVNNGTRLNQKQSLNGTWDGSLAIGDFDNDGYVDLVSTGQHTSSTNIIEFFTNNGTNFTYQGSRNIGGMSSSSIALFDYDDDGDLDLAVSGNNGSRTSLLYNSNVSIMVPNAAPSAPTDYNSTMKDIWLNLTWNNGTDDITPALGLYYNLKVGTKPGLDDIVSGKYGGSSNPTQGYIGNMQQRKQIALNVTTNRTYYWQVQTIDSGLKAGNWSSMQIYNPCPIPSNTDWNITVHCVVYNQTITVPEDKDINIKNGVSLTLINTTLLFSQTSNGISGLYVTNGSINISNSNISSSNSFNYSFLIDNNGNLTMLDSYLSKSGYSDSYGQRGLEINGTVNGFNNNILNNNFIGITFYSNNNEIKSSTISGSKKDIFALNANNNNLTNITFTSKNISNSDITVKYYVDLTVTGNGSTVSRVTVKGYNSTTLVDANLINTKTTNANGLSQLELIQYKDTNNVEDSYNPYTIQASAERFNTNSISYTLSGNGATTINLTLSGEPSWEDFKNPLTTNFTNLSSWTNVPNVTIGKPNLGLINFTQNVTIQGINLSSAISISYNSIYLDSINYPALNKSAKISFFNLSYSYTPAILKDGTVCPATICKGITYSNGNLTFNVTGFSNYTTASNSKLDVTLTNRYNNKPLVNESLWISANYTNRTSGAVIKAATTNCTVKFNDSSAINMSWNSSTSVYQYNRTFNSTGTWNYNISCIGSTIGYENLNLSVSSFVYLNVTYLFLNQSLEGIDQGSLVLGDINNDSWVDVTISGVNSSDRADSLIYKSNVSNLILNGSLEEGLKLGSLALIDYDGDGDLDLLQIGTNEAGSEVSHLYKNP